LVHHLFSIQMGCAIEITISKLVALLIAVVYVIAAGVSGEGWPFAATVALGVLIPLVLIWIPEEIDIWTRMWRVGLPGFSTSPSPAWMLAAMGWVFLIGLPLFVLLHR
jgi:hypothetical protein